MPTRVPGSLRSEGKTTIAVDAPTKALLKQLAGDVPVSAYVKGLAARELSGRGGGRPLTTRARREPIEAKVERSIYTVVAMMSGLLGVELKPPPVYQPTMKAEVEAELEALGKMVDAAKAKLRSAPLSNAARLPGLDESRARSSS